MKTVKHQITKQGTKLRTILILVKAQIRHSKCVFKKYKFF